MTARGGSKRVPGKNLRPLGGRPLLVWSIDIARQIADICDVVVSTDDEDIAAIARASGALVPWLRPPELATDTAQSVDVCLHALDWFEQEKGSVDGLLLLQPTSPFRTIETVSRGINLYREHQGRSVVGVSPAKSHPMWCFQIDGDLMRPFVSTGDINMRSQDLPAAYVLNGSFYLSRPDDLRVKRTLFDSTSIPLVMCAPREAVDIDTEWDWKLAKALLDVES